MLGWIQKVLEKTKENPNPTPMITNAIALCVRLTDEMLKLGHDLDVVREGIGIAIFSKGSPLRPFFNPSGDALSIDMDCWTIGESSRIKKTEGLEDIVNVVQVDPDMLLILLPVYRNVKGNILNEDFINCVVPLADMMAIDLKNRGYVQYLQRAVHKIHMDEITEDFARCHQAAGMHLQSQAQDSVIYWLRSDLSPPFLEHLSFRLGNQLFFIQLEDADEKIRMPGSLKGLLAIAEGCNGYACILPMKNLEGRWHACIKSGWGLVDAVTRKEINPFNLADDSLIKMTDWELHDMAVQIVREDLEKKGFKIMSSQGNPNVDPSLWFLGKNGSPEWVTIRHALYPEKQAVRPANTDEIARNCEAIGKKGNFASVVIANGDDSTKPPYRGHAMNILYTGLENLK